MGSTTQVDPEVTVALQGTLDTFALPDVLRLLAATKKSGHLHISGDRGSGRISLADGAVTAVDVPGAALATEPVDALLELLRCKTGSFSFDPEPVPGGGAATDVEMLLQDAEGLLAEWQEIEGVVPSIDAWVTLRPSLPGADVTIEQTGWATLVAVGSGRTVRRIGEALSLPEMAVSRAIRDLVELGVADVMAAAPAGAPAVTEPLAEEIPPAAAPSPEPTPEPAPPTGPRARRARSLRSQPVERDDAEPFVPLELGSMAPQQSYDEPPHTATPPVAPEPDGTDDDIAAAFPGLAGRVSMPTTEGAERPHLATAADDEELARQLATLSPRAAEAVRVAAEASTDEERDAALADATDGEDEPLDRGLLLKFLSSVKS